MTHTKYDQILTSLQQVSLLQRQSNTNIIALRHSALRFYYTPSRYTRVEAKASEPDRPYGTKSVYGTHERKAGLTTEAIGYIAMNLRDTGWYRKEVELRWYVTREDSEIQGQSMAREERKSQESPWTTVPVTQAFDSFMATAILIRFFREDLESTGRRHVIYSVTSPGSQLQRRHSILS